MSRKARDDAIIRDLLVRVGASEHVNQRTLAKELGIALGMTNAYVKRCVRKGLIKISEIPPNANPPVEDLFKAPSIITIQSVTGLPARNLNVTIHHTFARVDAGAEGLFGLDGPANIRIGIDVGVTDWLSVGVGRSRFDRQYDLRSKITVLRQRQNDSMPLQVAVTGSAAITTVSSDEMDFVDRMSYGGALLIARRFSDRVSLQVAPMVGHANTVFVQRAPSGVLTPENTVFAVHVHPHLMVKAPFLYRQLLLPAFFWTHADLFPELFHHLPPHP